MRNKNRKGSVLIMAMWVLLFLGVLTVISSGMTRQIMMVSGRIEERKDLYEGSVSGVLYAIKNYTEGMWDESDEDERKFDALNSKWINDPERSEGKSLGRVAFSLGYTYKDNVTGEEATWYGIMDETRRINLNYASLSVLRRLFILAGEVDEDRAEKIALSVIDWRDENDILYNQEGGRSERAYYRSQGYRYVPPNEDFTQIDELLFVDGMDREVFKNVEPYITVYGSGRININTASSTVMRSLGLEERTVDKLMEFRSGRDKKEGTRDDEVFISVSRIPHHLSNRGGFSGEEEDQFRNLINQDLLTTESDVFRVVSTSSTEVSAQKGVSVCVFNSEGEIKYYAFEFKTEAGE